MFGTIIRFLLGIVAACCVLLLIWVISRYPGRRKKVKKKSINTAEGDFTKIPYLPFGEKSSSPPAEDAAQDIPAQNGFTAEAGTAAAGIRHDGDGVAPEIAVVIAAAIAAFCEEEGCRLVVKKIRRLPSDASPWLAAARGDCMESRKF